MRHAYTMIEILMATLLTLILMFAVVTIFASISGSINDSRATLEMTDRLRATAARLQEDLKFVTVTMLPPRRPEQDEGYFEFLERSIGTVAANTTDPANPVPDSTVSDCDDILMFTTRSPDNPFVGRAVRPMGPPIVESHVAEVAWFVRGRTLYRRLLLVVPHIPVGGNGTGFFALNDISVRNEGGTLVANTLGDLTKRENRYAHQTGGFPFAANWGPLGLPTLFECSSPSWIAGGFVSPPALTPRGTFDAWINPHPWNELDTTTGNLTAHNGSRVAEDVILTNVIGFDVRAWDPGAPVYVVGNVALMPGDPGYAIGGSPVDFGAYVDLGFAPGYVAGGGAPESYFHHVGQLGRVYDTWSFHYEHDGIGSDLGTNGFDDNNDGVVDDPGEYEAPSPYPVPLRGIQVKIRTFEPDSRQVREVTIVQDFLSK